MKSLKAAAVVVGSVSGAVPSTVKGARSALNQEESRRLFGGPRPQR